MVNVLELPALVTRDTSAVRVSQSEGRFEAVGWSGFRVCCTVSLEVGGMSRKFWAAEAGWVSSRLASVGGRMMSWASRAVRGRGASVTQAREKRSVGNFWLLDDDGGCVNISDTVWTLGDGAILCRCMRGVSSHSCSLATFRLRLVLLREQCAHLLAVS